MKSVWILMLGLGLQAMAQDVLPHITSVSICDGGTVTAGMDLNITLEVAAEGVYGDDPMALHLEYQTPDAMTSEYIFMALVDHSSGHWTYTHTIPAAELVPGTMDFSVVGWGEHYNPGPPFPYVTEYYFLGQDACGNELSVNSLEFSLSVDAPTAATVDTPGNFALLANYPNPFNPSTVLNFTLSYTQQASMKVYNLAGQEVAILAAGILESGAHQVEFNAGQLPSGTYLAQLQAEEGLQTQKLLLIK